MQIKWLRYYFVILQRRNSLSKVFKLQWGGYDSNHSLSMWFDDKHYTYPNVSHKDSKDIRISLKYANVKNALKILKKYGKGISIDKMYHQETLKDFFIGLHGEE